MFCVALEMNCNPCVAELECVRPCCAEIILRAVSKTAECPGWQPYRQFQLAFGCFEPIGHPQLIARIITPVLANLLLCELNFYFLPFVLLGFFFLFFLRPHHAGQNKCPQPVARDSTGARFPGCTGTPPKSAAPENAAIPPGIRPTTRHGSRSAIHGSPRCANPWRNPAPCRRSACLVLGSPRETLSPQFARCRNSHPT